MPPHHPHRSAARRTSPATRRALRGRSSEWGDKTKAALAPRLAAEIYGLDILAEDVEDDEHNTTRFVILAAEPDDAEPGAGDVVTTFMFRVRNVPAALYKAMGGFATNGVNMTKLECYQVDGSFTATMFFADIEGHPADRNVRLAHGGAVVLLQRAEGARHLSGEPVPPRGEEARPGGRRHVEGIAGGPTGSVTSTAGAGSIGTVLEIEQVRRIGNRRLDQIGGADADQPIGFAADLATDQRQRLLLDHRWPSVSAPRAACCG